MLFAPGAATLKVHLQYASFQRQLSGGCQQHSPGSICQRVALQPAACCLHQVQPGYKFTAYAQHVSLL